MALCLCHIYNNSILARQAFLYSVTFCLLLKYATQCIVVMHVSSISFSSLQSVSYMQYVHRIPVSQAYELCFFVQLLFCSVPHHCE